MFPETGERTTRSLTALAPFTMKSFWLVHQSDVLGMDKRIHCVFPQLVPVFRLFFSLAKFFRVTSKIVHFLVSNSRNLFQNVRSHENGLSSCQATARRGRDLTQVCVRDLGDADGDGALLA